MEHISGIDEHSIKSLTFPLVRLLVLLVTDVYPVKTDKQFVNTLEDNIRQRLGCTFRCGTPFSALFPLRFRYLYRNNSSGIPLYSAELSRKSCK